MLELKPIKNKKIFVFLIRKENNNLSIDENEVLSKILEEYDFKFATITLEQDKLESFKQSDLANLLNEYMLPCYQVDIPEYAKGYLYSEITEDKDQIEELENEYKTLNDKNSFNAINLKSWIDYLKDEFLEKEKHIKTQLKTQWIVKKILDIIRYYEDSLYYEDTINVMYFTTDRLIVELKKLFEELGVIVIIGAVDPKILPPFPIIKNMEVN